MDIDPGAAATQDSRNFAVLNWIGTIFFGFIPGLVFLLLKPDDAFVQQHAKEALNWSITAIIGYFASLLLTFVLIGILGYFVVGACHLIFCVMGAVAAANGRHYRAPFAIRLIK